MTGRDRSYGKGRKASLKVKAGIAAAVLVGGGAVGAVAVAANGHSAPSKAQSAGYSSRALPSTEQLLISALSTGNASTQASDFSRMTGMRSFNQYWYHKKMFAVQRGIVVIATKKFIILKSANGHLSLWWLSGATRFKNVATSVSSMNSLTANTAAATSAMSSAPTAMVSATNLIAGSTTAATSLLTTTATTQTVTVAVAGTTTRVTVVVTATTAAVRTTTGTTTATTWQNAFFAPQKIRRGDLALIAGFRTHWNLHAQLVLFAPLTKSDLSSTPSSSGSTVPAGTSGQHS